MQLVVHSPYGGRINRALGLALRKKFCRTFNFELQAAASDDAIVLSLGPHHSFPLDEVPALPQQRSRSRTRSSTPSSTRRCSRPAGAGTSTARCMVLRFRNGRQQPAADPAHGGRRPHGRGVPAGGRVPGERQPARSRSPTTCSCARPSTTRCTRRSTSTALRALLERIEVGRRHRALRRHHRAVGARARDPHRAAVRVPRRRGVPEPAHQRGHAAARAAVDLAVDRRARSRRDRAGARRDRRPSPTRADDLHDLLCSLVLARARDEWRALWDELVGAWPRSGAASTTASSCGAPPSAHDDARARARRRRGRDRRGAARPPRDHAAITTVDELADATTPRARRGSAPGSPCSSTTGFALQGRYTAPTRSTPSGWRAGCWRACTRTPAAPGAAASSPRPPQDFMRFLLRWQHVAPGTQLAGEAGLAAVLEQLQGFEAAAVAWEPELLGAPAAATTTRPGSTGSATTARSAGCASRRAPRDDADAPAGAPSKATPISVVFRDDLAVVARGRARRRRSRRARRRRDRRGRSRCCASAARASRPSSATATNRLPEDIERALWDGVARGLRHVRRLRRDPRRVIGRRASGGTDARRLSRLLRGAALAGAGRRPLVARAHAPAPTSTATSSPKPWPSCCCTGGAWCSATSRCTTRCAFPWRDLQWALRRLEDRGLVRGGRFVTGFSGEQYALPAGASSSSPRRARSPRTGERVTLNATDPLNLVGRRSCPARRSRRSAPARSPTSTAYRKKWSWPRNESWSSPRHAARDAAGSDPQADRHAAVGDAVPADRARPGEAPPGARRRHLRPPRHRPPPHPARCLRLHRRRRGRRDHAHREHAGVPPDRVPPARAP